MLNKDNLVLVLVLTQFKLYQFTGTSILLQSMLEKAWQDKDFDFIHIESSLKNTDKVQEQFQNLQDLKHCNLSLFYDERNDLKDSKLLGFGWRNEYKFCYGYFTYS